MNRYANATTVSSEKSRAEIETMVRQYGATRYGYTWEDGEERIVFEVANRQIMLRMPLPDREEFDETEGGRARTPAQATTAWEQACRSRWRALAMLVRMKLEAVEVGISTVEREFLADVALPNGMTLGEWVLPQIEAAYAGEPIRGLLSA